MSPIRSSWQNLHSKRPKSKGVRFLLPVDTLGTNALDFDAKTLGDTKVFEGDIEDGWEGVDIGPKTTEIYSEEVSKAKTVLWNRSDGCI